MVQTSCWLELYQEMYTCGEFQEETASCFQEVVSKQSVDSYCLMVCMSYIHVGSLSCCTEYCPGQSDRQLPTFQKNVAACIHRIEGSIIKKVERKAEWVTKNKEWPVRVRDGEESKWALGLLSGESSSL